MITAYVDESLRRPAHDYSVYAMAAVLIDSADHAEVRSELEALRLGKSPRLHWRDESSARRLAVTEALTKMPLRGFVTVCLHDRGVRTERARRRCLERLLMELDQTGVVTTLIESRSAPQDHADLLMVMAMRKARALSKSLTVLWQSSYAEPLLWAADAVVGAATWWLDGHPDYFNLLGERISVLDLT